MSESVPELTGFARLAAISQAKEAQAKLALVAPVSSPPPNDAPPPTTPLAPRADAPPPTDSPPSNASPPYGVDLWQAIDDVHTGHVKLFTVITDTLLPQLSAFEQIVYIHLYRLSWGYRKPTCKIGLSRLAARCGIKQTALRETINKLENKNLIRRVSHEFGKNREQGTVYRVSLPDALSRSVSPPFNDSPPRSDTIIDKTQIDTHTTEGVRVSSRFSLAECRRYAESLRADGITNPGGYATKIHRSGEADELIAKFLEPVESAKPFDVSGCPDCHGTGFYEPGGAGKGVAKCKHKHLLETK